MIMLRLAGASARAHRAGLTGTVLVLALAGALLSVTGVLLESGFRAGNGTTAAAMDGAMLATLAGSFGGTAILVVALVVVSTLALALRQRRRELALLRAVGATRWQVRRLIGTELMLVAALATPPGALAGLLLADRLTPALVAGGIVSRGFRLTLTPIPVLAAVVLLISVALAAAAFATRETLRTPPTEAVRESTVEPRRVGRARRITALVLAACGLGTATTPMFAPGTTGSEIAATSALLLIAASALAGPLLIGWCLDRALLRQVARGVAGRLAIANTRGFAIRLTTAIVPLVMVLATGTNQTSVDGAVTAASRLQLQDGLHADVVVARPGPAALATVVHTPGAVSAARVSAIPAEVSTDPDAPDALSWDPASMQVLSAGALRMVDLGTVHGSLAALSRPDTIAASSDELAGSGIGAGDRVPVRLGGIERTMTVVATYSRGLGFGDYVTGTATLREHGLARPASGVLVRTRPGAAAAVVRALRRSGLHAMGKAAYVATATTPAAGSQHLSLILLLALLGFIALAAADALVMTTASRGAELALLRRTGATRRQLLTMATWEAAIAAGTAWAIGTVAVIPATIGVDVGLLGWRMPSIGWPIYGGLSALVAVIALAATVPTVAWQLRSRVSVRA